MRYFVVTQSLLLVAGGIILPFYILILNDFSNSTVAFASLYALFAFATAVTHVLLPAVLDGPIEIHWILMGSCLLAGGGFCLVPHLSSWWHVVGMQIILGMALATQRTIEKVVLYQKLTPKESSQQIGNYHAIIGLCSALGILSAGWLVETFSLLWLFYIIGALYMLSAFVSIRI